MTGDGVETRPSGIDGVGLFTTRGFRAGERLAPYAGRKTDRPAATKDGKVFALEVRPGLWIDGAAEDNPGRAANHSCEPNAELVWDDAAGLAWLTAAKDLDKDEEVTFDYGFSLSEALGHPCACGSPACAGRIVAAPLRAALRRHLRQPGSRRD